MFDEHFIPEG